MVTVRLFAALAVCVYFLWGAYASATLTVRDGVSASRGSHWLEFRGKKAWLVGDSVTQGWMELGEHFDQTAYVDALAKRGINVLHLWSYIGVVDQRADKRIGYDAPALWPWLRFGALFDLRHVNDSYFDRLRALVQYANTKNVVVVITVHDGWTKRRFSGHPFNGKNGGPLTDRSEYVALADYNGEMPKDFDPAWDPRQKHQYFLERFCERLIRATADKPNVIYEIFNEGEWYDQTRLRAFQVHFLKFFKTRTTRPLMINDDHVGGSDFQGDPDCDIISVHQSLWTAEIGKRRISGRSLLRLLGSGKPLTREIYDLHTSQFERLPSKPYFLTESVPEHQGDLTRRNAQYRSLGALNDAYMRVIWGSLLAGAAGIVIQNDSSFGFDPRAAIANQSSHRDMMLDLQGHAARFIRDAGINLQSMRPQGELSSTGVVLADSQKEYVVYAQEGDALNVDFAGAAGEYAGRFFNPRSGEFRPSFSIAAQPRLESIRKPDRGDWVLHLLRRH